MTQAAAPSRGLHLDHDWFAAPLPAGVTLGGGSWLYSSFAFRHCHSLAAHPVVIGRDTGLYNGTFFDLGPRGTVRIGDCCTIVGAIFCVDCPVSIGDHALIAHQVVFADEEAAVPGGSNRASEAPQRRRPIVLRENVWIGARSIVLAGAEIGEGAVIGAGTVVDFPVPAFAIVAGSPARIVGDCRGRA